MNTAHTVLKALERMSDQRGYIRATAAEIADATNLSPPSVRRAFTELAKTGQIQRRSKPGPSGGYLIKLSSPLQPDQKCDQNCDQNCDQSDHSYHAFDQTPGPEGALGGLVRNTQTDHNSQPSTSSRGFAYRPVASHETPESGAELLYTGPDGAYGWHQISKTLWLAPNGDNVSTKSMTPELRLRLRVEEP